MKRIILAAMIVAVTACGGNAALSSVGPSSTSSAGASISGTVNGISATRALNGGAFSLLATSSVTVSIAGTNISTTTDGQGQFTLNNVPEGTVTLNFTGPGQSATITLSGIGPDDKVEIAVTLNGTTARVDSERHTKPDNSKREFQGRISSIDATAKSFQIPGMTIKTTAATTIRHGNRSMQFSDLKVGNHIQARGTTAGSTLTASEIKVEGENDDDDDDEGGQTPTTVSLTGAVSGSTGTCPSVTFTVQSTKVTVNNATTYTSTTCADATKNDATVKVTGTKQSDGSVLATSVSLTTPAPTTLTGLISGSTGTCPAVTFTVQSTKVTVNSSTTYTSTTCAAATVNNANVKVTGPKQSDGSVLATTVALVP